jgi:hypothetical protein
MNDLGPMTTWIRSAAGLAMLLSTGVAEAQPPERDAIGDWALERAPARCVISRRYGSSEAQVTLGIKAPPRGDAVQIVVLRPGHRNRIEQTRARILVDARTVETTALSYPLDARGRRVAHLINLSGEDSSALRNARELQLRVTDGINRSFSLGAMAEAWKQLDSCLERLRKDWNLGEVEYARLATGPEPLVPLSALLGDEDYPISAARANQGGSTGIILLIDEKGAVKDCTLTETSGFSTLDSRSCSLLLDRARFKPATDLRGRPVKGAIRTRISWVHG